MQSVTTGNMFVSLRAQAKGGLWFLSAWSPSQLFLSERLAFGCQKVVLGHGFPVLKFAKAGLNKTLLIPFKETKSSVLTQQCLNISRGHWISLSKVAFFWCPWNLPLLEVPLKGNWRNSFQCFNRWFTRPFWSPWEPRAARTKHDEDPSCPTDPRCWLLGRGGRSRSRSTRRRARICLPEI